MTPKSLFLRPLLAALLACSAFPLAAQGHPSAGATAATPAGSETAAPSFIVRGATVFDGQQRLADTDVLVQAGRIAQVGSAGQRLAVPAGATVVEGRGRTLLPGLIDGHVHTWGSARRDALRLGVTTELEMFGDPRGLAAARAERQSLAAVPALQQKADLWSAGVLATVPRGHGTQFGLAIPTVTQASEAAAFVKARLAEGSDYLKIVIEDGSAFGMSMPSLTGEVVTALAGAARAEGKLAVAHVSTEADAWLAVQAGMHGLVHAVVNQRASTEWLALAKARGIFMTPTLTVFANAAGQSEGPGLADDPRLKPWLSVSQAATLRTPFHATQRPAPGRAQLLDNGLANVRALHEAGVTLLAGTDAGNPGTAHGASMHSELALLVRAGLSPSQALTAATAAPAQVFGLADRGRIASGLRADLLLVEGDPTQDISASRAIVGLWKNGQPVDRSLQPDERAAPAAAGAPQPPADPLVADFEEGRIAVKYGQNWTTTTDQMAGGQSTATQAWQAGGARGSAGALRVQGEVAPGLAYAWAGTLFMPGAQPFAAMDFSARKTLVFQARAATPRALSAMLFSGPATQRMPSVVPFPVGADWAEVRIPLQQFQGADLSQLRALALTAGQPAGPFSFEIDDLRFE